jgi:hypothetical protein
MTPGQPSPSRGQVPKSNDHTEIIDEVLCLKVEWVTQKVAQISPRKLKFEWSLRKRGFELKRECFKEYARAELSGQMG